MKYMIDNLDFIIPSLIALVSLIFNFVQYRSTKNDSRNDKIEKLKEEISQLKKENDDLLNLRYLDEKFFRHESTYLSLKNDNGTETRFCSACWDNERKKIQIKNLGSNRFVCPVCGNGDYFQPGTHYREEQKPDPLIGKIEVI